MSEAERKKVTVRTLARLKRQGRKITMLTAYDYPTAGILDRTGVDVILVGDTVGMVVLGMETTLPVTMDEMIHHCAAVARARPRALLVGDMPFLSFTVSVRDTVRNAGRMVKEGGVEAVKLEGGRAMIPMVRAIARASIPVMGHLGLTPQSILRFGGYKVQGKRREEAERLVDAARGLEDAGCFAIVLEAIPADVAARVTERVSVPTIGIGAGPHCDGQVLVTHDLLGVYEERPPRFVKRYADLRGEMTRAFTEYVREVREGVFPAAEHCYESEEEKEG
ncbi:MAG: 3-methyl-2-oxobutanoate hydroxymethyltransferase [Candidatus Eisenbacteria bacterium]|nr:3-methyl-2-oxobutanoate hydroxymethyltransferase [Candidatus Eisenbacteria bacterium]